MLLEEAAQLARQLMTEHGLFQLGWKFMFSGSNKSFGQCKYRVKCITLSSNMTLLNNEEEVRDTLLHEIAHALTPGHGHNAIWKAKCREIGARPERLADAARTTVPIGLWEDYCETCGFTRVQRRQRLKKRVACARCCKLHNGGKFSEKYVFKQRRRVEEIPE